MTETSIERQPIAMPYKDLGSSPTPRDVFVKPCLSIVLPAFNEEESIRGVVLDYFGEIVTKLPARLVVAEDGSVDQTPKILANLASEIPMTLLSDRNRKGYAKGVADALKACREEWVFFSDSDGQYFPSDFWNLWENRGRSDLIIGRKVHRDESLHRILLSKCFHLIFNNMFGLSLNDADCGFRLIRKDVINRVVDETKILRYSFWAEFTIRACLRGFKVCEVPITHANRANGGTRIYSPSKIPLIIVKQLMGLARLFADVRRN